MRILAINSVVCGSTGHIMLLAAEQARLRGHEVMVAVPKCRTNRKQITPQPYLFGHAILRNIGVQLAFYTGYSGCFNIIDTKLFLEKIDVYKPDIIHIHNLHSEFINLRLLFNYIKKNEIPVIWTLHDCWSFTGGCSHFVLQKCDKWKTQCYDCKIHRQYPGSYFDNTRKMWKIKKQLFTNVPYLYIVTPSYWLGSLVQQSYLNTYPVHVIHNGIDLDIFQPRKGNFLDRYKIEGYKVVLGVSSGWGFRKGGDVFVKLSKLLPDDYRIILVGTTPQDEIDLPLNIIPVRRTDNQKQLSELYTSADVFVNPTREDTFPTVNLEALACGTPVITFKTGGSPECIDETCGIVVPVDDIEGMCKAIVSVCENKQFSNEACLARSKKFDQQIIYNKYVDLYEDVIKTSKMHTL